MLFPECLQTFPAGGLGVAPVCLGCPATLKPLSFENSFMSLGFIEYKSVDLSRKLFIASRQERKCYGISEITAITKYKALSVGSL